MKEKETVKSDVVEIPVGKWFAKIRGNLWIVSTIVLAVVLVIVIFTNNSPTQSISADAAANSVVTFLNSNPNLDSEISIVSSEKDGSLYKVTLNYQGQDVPLYTTLDGKYLVGNIVP